MLYLAISLFWGLVLQVFIPGFPKETLLLLSGSSLGLVVGSFVNWMGMVCGAQIAYEVVHRSVRLGGRFAGILDRYEGHTAVVYLQNHGNKGLFILRLIPTAPNDILSMISGGLFLPRKGFLLVSIITAVPYSIFFAYLGWIGSQFLGFEMMWRINLILLAITISVLSLRWVLSRDDSS